MHVKTLPTDSYGVGMGNKPEMTATISHYDNLGTVSAADSHLPMMLQSSLKVGASPATPASLPYWFNMPFCAARGSGIVSVIGRWNLRRRGSIVMIGLTATRLPSILDTRFGGTGCAWIAMHHSLKRYRTVYRYLFKAINVIMISIINVSNRCIVMYLYCSLILIISAQCQAFLLTL